MSAAELQALLKKKKAEEKAAKANAKKGYDQLRDSYIDTVFSKMEDLSAQLRDFKGESVKLGIELHTKMYQTLGREPKDGIDSYTLTSADGLRRVSIERQWRCEYDETSTVAIDTIKAVLRDKFEGRNKSMYRIIDDILSKNGTGDYDERWWLACASTKKRSTISGSARRWTSWPRPTSRLRARCTSERTAASQEESGATW